MIKQKRELLKNQLGLKIKSARMGCGLIQKELADKLKVHKITIANWETGRFEPSQVMLNKISEITGKPFGEQQISEPKSDYGAGKDIAKIEQRLDDMAKELRDCKDNYRRILEKLDKLDK